MKYGGNHKKGEQVKSLNASEEDKLKKLSIQVNRIYKNFYLIERLEQIRRSECHAKNLYEYNFVINDKIFEELASRKFDVDQSDFLPKNSKEGNKDISLYDVISDDDRVTITIDMLGKAEEKINLRITSDIVEVIPNGSEGRYYRYISLPCKVKPESAIITYKNGILDIVISRNKDWY